jgi:hypothetical protein
MLFLIGGTRMKMTDIPIPANIHEYGKSPPRKSRLFRIGDDEGGVGAKDYEILRSPGSGASL